MSVEIENQKKDAHMRTVTDSHMTIWWIIVYLLPIISLIIWVAVFVSTLISYIISLIPLPPTPDQLPVFPWTPLLSAATAGLYLTAITTFILHIILTYRLIKRRNHHFRRQIFLFEDIMATIRKTTAKKGIDAEFDIGSLDRTLREIKAEETESEKSAMLWAILSPLTGLPLLYIWYFLMKDFSKHEKREDTFWAETSKILNKAGIKLEVPARTNPLPERSFALYLILNIITAGFFGIYWLYTLLNDPNIHFKYHIKIEDHILPILENSLA
jgi:hypothetical protein